MNKKNIYLLGATGSIGTQTLDVIDNNPDKYELITISFGRQIDKGIEIIKKFKPKFVSTMDSKDALKIKLLFPEIEVGFGDEGLIHAATYDSYNSNENLVVTAVVGSVGLTPTIKAIKKGYNIGLANKETLVTAGHLVMKLAEENHVKILPIDSEHAAIFQCLNGEDPSKVEQLIITASGGSFRDKTREELVYVTIKDALNHPNWSMGAKITIDSATMMNKGLEVIEAHWLFNLPYERISTILHKESVIHSMVEFIDTAVIAQLGTPDMRIPIQYALAYPERIVSKNSRRLNLAEIGKLNFKEMDYNRFPCLKFAYDAGIKGGSMPTVLNAANEAAVGLFLQGKIKFLDIEKLIYQQIESHHIISNPDLETVLALDQEIKAKVSSLQIERS
ncbi:MAG: 1-deoxy-D-xylulose 5-phosphate reductoisomerase [Haloplasmataceae bacterium]|jgi:1-deoxy-D-xylulose-5-phosphate reductoisomerase|nr:1-deoxy-D-xylulose 5-phosphate reductoisomerase [Haloplasmataceae bacterium]